MVEAALKAKNPTAAPLASIIAAVASSLTPRYQDAWKISLQGEAKS
jgi:hypothetical protein